MGERGCGGGEGQRGPRGDAAVVAERQCELVASACQPAHLPVLEVHWEHSSLIGTCTSRRAGQGEDSPQCSEHQAAAGASLAESSPVDWEKTEIFLLFYTGEG